MILDLCNCFQFLFKGSNKKNDPNKIEMKYYKQYVAPQNIYSSTQKIKQNKGEAAININQNNLKTKCSHTQNIEIQSQQTLYQNLIPQQTFQDKDNTMGQQSSFNHQPNIKPIIQAQPSNSKPNTNILPSLQIKPSSEPQSQPKSQPKANPNFIKPLPKPKAQQQKIFSLKEIEKMPQNVILLIGSEGTRKTQIFKGIKTQTNEDTFVLEDDNDFTFLMFSQFIIFDTPPFELVDDIDVREKTIKKFSPIFKALHRQIQAFVIVTKFERTDIMKKNIMDSYKFLQKFKQKICLMISDFHLSENCTEDKKELYDRLKIFVKDSSKILFFDYRYQESINEIKQIFEQIANNQRPSLKFEDTIFEEQSSLEAQQLQYELSQALMNQFNNRLTNPLIRSN